MKQEWEGKSASKQTKLLGKNLIGYHDEIIKVIIHEWEEDKCHCGAFIVLGKANKKGINMLLKIFFFFFLTEWDSWFGFMSPLIMPVFRTHSAGVSEFIGTISSWWDPVTLKCITGNQ